MDYRWRLSNTNIHQATLEADGELVVVVSHDDPGLPNWLDPSGHEEGYITFRWMGSHEDPRPTCTQVSRESLMQNLPANIRTISPDARSEQLRARRRGVNRRFKI